PSGPGLSAPTPPPTRWSSSRSRPRCARPSRTPCSAISRGAAASSSAETTRLAVLATDPCVAGRRGRAARGSEEASGPAQCADPVGGAGRRGHTADREHTGHRLLGGLAHGAEILDVPAVLGRVLAQLGIRV